VLPEKNHEREVFGQPSSATDFWASDAKGAAGGEGEGGSSQVAEGDSGKAMEHVMRELAATANREGGHGASEAASMEVVQQEGGGKGGGGADSSSDWLSRESQYGELGMCSEGAVSAEGGVGGGKDWVDRSSSTAGSDRYRTRVSMKQHLLRRTLLNAASALLHLHMPAQAEEACTQVLATDARSAKALFRRGCARASLHLWAAAEIDLKEALLVQPNSQAIRGQLRKVEVHLQHQAAAALPGLKRARSEAG